MLGMFWILLASFILFQNYLEPVGIIFSIDTSADIMRKLFLQAIFAGCLCRLSLQLSPLESFLEQLGWPGILASECYVTFLRVSWAPRVSRVSRALLVCINGLKH